jgi:hypothetical protein
MRANVIGLVSGPAIATRAGEGGGTGADGGGSAIGAADGTAGAGEHETTAKTPTAKAVTRFSMRRGC